MQGKGQNVSMQGHELIGQRPQCHKEFGEEEARDEC